MAERADDEPKLKEFFAAPMQYRNDIAGLRAVAVLPILLVHAGLESISGGFTGVDIFFVISGYLITRIILKEMDGDRFTLGGFYRRRALRILPALLVMLVVVLAVGWWRLFPQDMRDLSWGAAATALSVSNIWFWREVSYFGDAELTILLHTWSLGVEEQFYILYPLLVIGLHQWSPRHIVQILWAIVVTSLAIGFVLIEGNKAAAAFYLLPARSWELGLGALVATGGFPALGPRLKALAAWLGFAMVAAGLFVITEESPFPAPWALLPCIGTALLIAYGDNGATARLLSLAPIRFVGDISFSLYLWHWPVMAFWRIERGIVLDTGEMVATITISFILAILSYQLIERPFLERSKTVSTQRVLQAALAAMLSIAGVATLMALQAASTEIADPRVANILTYLDYDNSSEAKQQFDSGKCMADSENPNFDIASCATLSSNRPNVMVIGDSHAGQVARAIGERLAGAQILQVTASGCRPVWPTSGDRRCTEVMDIGFGKLAGNGALGRVILSARWQEDELEGVLHAVRHFRNRGVAVTVLGPSVEYDEPLPRLLARAVARDDLSLVRAGRSLEPAKLDRIMAPRVRAAGATYVSMYETECPAGVCPLFASDGGPFHFDYGHYTLPASRQIVSAIHLSALEPSSLD